VRAVTFDVTIPRYLLARSAGRVSGSVIHGRMSAVRLRDVDPPPLPGPEWVRLEVLRSGICGTDLNTIEFSASPSLEPFGSFPAVLGHEILAKVIEVGPAVRRVETGQRVAVDPLISCQVRGQPREGWCSSCSAGAANTCQKAAEPGPGLVDGDPIAPGLTLGFNRSLPGGWGEEIVAHESQLFAVDDALEDHAAALIEPLSIGMHAALGSPAEGSGPVLVIGSGPIALAAIWALRATGYGGELLAQTKRPHEARLARRLGASGVVTPGDAARDALIDTGASAYMPIIGPEVYAGGGFPLIYDCVGSAQSLGQALRFAAPRARLVVLGCAAKIPNLDLTFLWNRELDVKGYVCYGTERFRGEERHTFEVTHDLLLETGAPVQEMVTHVFPLRQYRDALGTAFNRARTGSVKVLLDPTPLGPRPPDTAPRGSRGDEARARR
jgi:threonine dehydrogenase-like Zn-dependent dehydrogenase